jgi:hypothetical protein
VTELVNLWEYQPTHNWAFVLNRIQIDAPLPFELAPGCVLDRPNAEEMEVIRLLLETNAKPFSMVPPADLYEQAQELTWEGNSAINRWTPLPEDSFRYFVVRVEDQGARIDVQMIANLTGCPLDLSFFFQHGGGQHSSMLRMHHNLSVALFTNVPKVGQGHLREIASLLELSKGVCAPIYNCPPDAPYPELARALQMSDSLDLLTPYSEFQVLGLFAIIEMLITHNPKLEDRGDSITHQMKSKIPLLSNRFDRQVDYPSRFGEASEAKVWSALYAYRSAIAHGGAPDFNKDLRVIKDAQTACGFLREVVNALLRHSLREPQLYRDIREC